MGNVNRTRGARRLLVGVVVILIGAVVAAPAAAVDECDQDAGFEADTLLGANFRISDWSALTSEESPAVAYNSAADEYLVVWSDTRNAVSVSDIYGQRVSSNGVRLGGNFLISGVSASGGEYNPAVAYNPALDQYLVVWDDHRDYGTRGSDIYGQRVRAGGSLAGSNFRISAIAATDDEKRPDVTYNPGLSQYLVVWVDARNSSFRGADIYGQRVRAGGTMAGGNFRISGGSAVADDLDPAVTYSPVADQFLVAWLDERDLGTRGSDVYGQRVRAGGSMAGGNFRISGWSATADVGPPALAYNSTWDQYLIVWEDYRNGPTRQWDIYGQRVRSDGSMAGVNFRISGGSAVDTETTPKVTYSATWNRYLVVWSDHRNYCASGRDIYGQQVRAGGTRLGGNFRISGWSATSHENKPAVALNPSNNQNLVVWDDSRDYVTRSQDIYGQRVRG